MQGIRPTKSVVKAFAVAIGAVSLSGVVAAMAAPGLHATATPEKVEASVSTPDAATDLSTITDQLPTGLPSLPTDLPAVADLVPSGTPTAVPDAGELPPLPDPTALMAAGMAQLQAAQAMLPGPDEIMAAVETCRSTIGTDPTAIDPGPCLAALRALAPDLDAVAGIFDDVIGQVRPFLPPEAQGALDMALGLLPSTDAIGAVFDACVPGNLAMPDPAMITECLAAIQGMLPAAPGLDLLDDVFADLPVGVPAGLPAGLPSIPGLPGLPGGDLLGGLLAPLAPLFNLLGLGGLA